MRKALLDRAGHHEALIADRRADERLPVDEQLVTVKVLPSKDTGMRGEIVNVSCRGMRLRLEATLPPGAAVEILTDHSKLFGEVIYSQQEGENHFAGVHLDQFLDKAALAQFPRS